VSRRPDDQIHRIFFDPSGKHLIISLESGDNYYLHARWKKVKALPKLKVRAWAIGQGAGRGEPGVDHGFLWRGPALRMGSAAIARGGLYWS